MSEALVSVEKGIFRNPSKKFWIWVIGYVGKFAACIAVQAYDGVDPWVGRIFAAGTVLDTMTALLGISYMDAAIRGMRELRKLKSGAITVDLP
jgi:hypothetical protein